MNGEDVGHVYINTYPRGYSSGWSDGKGDVYDHAYPPYANYEHNTYHQPQYTFNRENADEFQEYDQAGDYVGNEIYVESKASQAGQLDEDGHLQVEDLYGVQSAVLYAQFTGSLDDFQKNPRKAVWTLSHENQKQLMLNNRSNNRANATDSDRSGDLSKAIIVGASVINTSSSFGTDLGLKITGMEPRVLTGNGNFSWIIGANSGYQPVGRSVYQPNNIFTRYMYKNYDVCDTKSLNAQVRFDMGGENTAMVDTRGFVWDVMMRNVGTQDSWGDFSHTLRDIEDERRAGQLRNPFVEVPRAIADFVHGSIKEQVEQIEKSFVDLRNFRCSVQRVDGEAWNQCNGLIGESVVFDEQSKMKLREHALYKTCTASAAIEIKYVLYE